MTIRHTDDLCHGPHGDQDQARAMDGLYLCQGCVNGIKRNLARLPDLYEQLAEMHTAPAGDGSGRVSGTPEKRLPINPAVAEHRHQIQHDLVWWSIYVADERGIGQPADGRPATTAAYLLTHVEWIAARRECAEELPPVLRSLAGRAGGLIDPARKMQTGERCRMLPDGVQRCAGVVTMVIRDDEIWSARCDVCGPQEAAPYMRAKVRDRWVTADRVVTYAASLGHRIGAATVRQWAHRGHIVQEEAEGRVWYELGSVEKYLSGRKQREKVGA